MHSFHGKTINIHHHGDWEGEILINPRGGEGEPQIRADINDLIEFVADIVRFKQQEYHEDIDSRKLLGFPPEETTEADK